VVSHMLPASRHRQFVRRGNSHRLFIRPDRRLISLMLLLGIVCTFLPLPAPVLAPFPGLPGQMTTGRTGVEKDLSRPFPCAQRVCGCRSAEQCWRKCCCFSDAEKVAWADSRGVELPEFVRQSAARVAEERPPSLSSWLTSSQETAARQSCAQPSGTDRSACSHCETGESATPKSGPLQSGPLQSGPVRRTTRQSPQSPLDTTVSDVVIVQDALACQGIHWQWKVAPGTPSRPLVTLLGREPPPVRGPVPTSLRPDDPLVLVPTPPPRRDFPSGNPA